MQNGEWKEATDGAACVQLHSGRDHLKPGSNEIFPVFAAATESVYFNNAEYLRWFGCPVILHEEMSVDICHRPLALTAAPSESP